MGLYDYINEEQVKVFFHPIYDEATKDTWHSGGSMIGYIDGDKVPIKTLYYKRPKNFIIFDDNGCEKNALLHIIKDGNINKTICLTDATDNCFNDIDTVLTYYGYNLKIKSKQNCLDFIKDKNYLEDTTRNINNDHTNIFNKTYIPSYWIISHIKPSKSIDEFRPDRKSKLKVIFKGINYIEAIQETLRTNFNFKSFDDFLEELCSDDLLWDKFCKIIYPIANEIHEESKKQLDKIKEETTPLTDKIHKEFNDKYFIENLYSKEMQLGEYLECLRYMYTDRNEARLIKDLASSKERYDSLILAIKEFLSNNTSIIQSYIEWLELNELQAKNIIDIFDCIQNDSEDIPVKYLDEIINSFN